MNSIYMEKLYTVREVAHLKLLGYKERKIRQLIKNGDLKVVKVGEYKDKKRASIRIPESALKEFLANVQE